MSDENPGEKEQQLFQQLQEAVFYMSDYLSPLVEDAVKETGSDLGIVLFAVARGVGNIARDNDLPGEEILQTTANFERDLIASIDMAQDLRSAAPELRKLLERLGTRKDGP